MEKQCRHCKRCRRDDLGDIYCEDKQGKLTEISSSKNPACKEFEAQEESIAFKIWGK